MRRVDDPALADYLGAENAWTDARTAHLAGLRHRVEGELASVLPDEDVSAPWRRGGWEHRTRRVAGQQYAVHVRRPVLSGGSLGPEDVLLDENLVAAGHDFLELGVCEVSPDGRLLAYSVDHDGSEVYRLLFRDLATGEDLPDVLEGTYYGLGWAADSGSVLYTTVGAAYRPDTVHRHVLGTGADRDEVVWHEPDRRFELDVRPTRSGAYVRLVAASRDTTEVRLVDTSRPADPPVVVEPRRPGREYHVDHQPGPAGGRLLVVVDDEGPEFRLVTAPVATPGRGHWQEVIGHRADTRVVAADAFGDHVVVTERHGGRRRLRVLDRVGSTLRLLEPAGAGESVALGRTDEADVPAFRVVREGWVRPPIHLDHDLVTGEETVVHVQAVLGGRRPDDYVCEVETVAADDGAGVPLSLVTRRGSSTPGPALLYGYGAYESAEDPVFWPELAPLLDRGVTFAVAHVRGGGERGRSWWLQGRLLHKRATFTDFVACARYLVTTGRTEPARLAARGLSAGGLLMGATTHLAPELFAVVVAEVPFVDVVNTMLDDTLPLTVGEWEEWGDPRDREAYEYLRSYSPYENLPGPRRPALLVTASRHDPRVSVHEPAKWVAAMRADEAALPPQRRPEAPLLLRTLLGGGAHTGPAGRYDAWAHEALILAVVLEQIGAADVPSSAGDGQLRGGVDRSPGTVVEPALGQHDAAR
jgi:oligopeptidase B